MRVNALKWTCCAKMVEGYEEDAVGGTILSSTNLFVVRPTWSGNECARSTHQVGGLNVFFDYRGRCTKLSEKMRSVPEPCCYFPRPRCEVIQKTSPVARIINGRPDSRRQV